MKRNSKFAVAIVGFPAVKKSALKRLPEYEGMTPVAFTLTIGTTQFRVTAEPLTDHRHKGVTTQALIARKPKGAKDFSRWMMWHLNATPTPEMMRHELVRTLNTRIDWEAA